MDCYQTVRTRLKEWGSHPVLVECAGQEVLRELAAAELESEVQRLSRLLREAGIGEGRTVALVLANSIDCVCMFLALLAVRAVPVPLKPEYRRTELREIFDNAQPAAVITDAGLLPVLRQQVPEPLAGLTVVVREPSGFRLLRRGGPAPSQAAVAPEVASINYTYRGTGLPLGALVTHRQYLEGAEILQGGLQGLPGERMLVVLPMSHIFALVGCLFVPLLFGMTAVICPSVHPRLLFAALGGLGIQYLTAVPELLLLLANCRRLGPELPQLRAFVSGGSRLSSESYHAVRQAFGVDLMHGYGLTEFAPVSRNVRGATRPGTVGPLGAGVQCRIRDPGPDGGGEIQIRTAAMARGYHRRPEESAQALEDGWFRTGDEGRLDGEHLVFVRERKATCKVNGNMVDLAEVRRVMLSFAGVAVAEVAPSGSALAARIRTDTRADPRQFVNDLRRYMLDRIAGYKVPSRITFS